MATLASDWLAWRINRLRCMSPAEIAHRVGRLAAAHAERWRAPARTLPAPDLARRATAWFGVPPGIDPAPYLAAADRLLAGRFDIFALHDAVLGSPPRWNRDPKSGVEAPLAFGKLLDYRDPAQVGDIKYLWEVNRHMHLVTFAQACALGGGARYAEALRRHLDDWIASCPYGQGANWSSALEAAIRLINWSLAWQLIGGVDAALFAGDEGARFRRRWLDSVHRHAAFVRGFFSLHSSANNHLIGEAAGLFVAAVTWPHWPQAARWRDAAQAVLEREARLQNAGDGVNREQSTSYQQYEIDVLLLPLLAGAANGCPFSADYAATIERMLDYLASVMDVAGNVPMIGDSDDGLVVRLAPAADDSARYRSVLATGAFLFRRGEFLHKARAVDDKTRWLLGAAAAAPPPAAVGPLPVRRAFREGGYYLLGDAFETPAEVRVLVDAGPLGYQRIAAHGHADALAFTLSVGGREFLIDPGTYAYHTQGAWRQYFRGTAAHNTLRVDGFDQSQPGGNFMWLQQAVAGCSHWQSTPAEDVFEGWHDGYRRLADPVTHRRRLVFDKHRRRLHIEDRLRMQGEHAVELFFHCGERCAVRAEEGGYILDHGGQRVVLHLPTLAGARHEACRGSVDPIAGWVSRRFDEKQPTTTIRWHGRFRGDVVLVSTIDCLPATAGESERTMPLPGAGAGI